MTLFIVYLIPVSLCEWSMLWSIYEHGFLENFCNYKLGHGTKAAPSSQQKTPYKPST